LQKHEIVILIPCYNEEKTILNVCKAAKKFAEVLVVDDASTDNTKKILEKNRVKFISNSTNQGYEKNLINGFKFIIKNLKKKKYVLTLDADGEFSENSISKLISLMKRKNSDLVIGKRSKFNRFSERLLNFIFFKKFKISDPVSGLKIYKIKFLRKTIKELSCSMFLVDLVCMFKKMNLAVENTEVLVEKRLDNSRVGNYLTSNLKILKITFQAIIF
jgi:glycosyltransferase involved in cell wall biosynthesis